MLIRVSHAGVNPVETYIRAGTYPALPPLPFTPGGDGAGVVEAVGADVRKVAPGDRVFCLKSATGTYAKHAVCEQTTVFK